MSKVKDILKAFWQYTEDYDGEISCRKTGEKNGCEFYTVETDGNTFTAAIWNNAEYAPDRNVVMFKVAGGQWRTTDGLCAVEVDGVPYIPDIGVTAKTPSELAAEANVSVMTVYNRAKELNRLPTVEELKKRKSTGRPRKY